MIYNTDTKQILEFLVNLLTMALCIILQLLTIYLFLKSSKKKQQLYAAILLILNFNLLMQMTIPSILGLFYSYSLEQSLRISPFSILETVFFQFIYVVCFLSAFHYKRYIYYGSINSTDFLNTNSIRETNTNIKRRFDNKKFIFILLGIYLLITNFSVAGMVQTVAEIAGEIQKNNTFFDIINIYLRTMFEWTALVTAVIFLFTFKGSKILKTLVLLFCIGIIIHQLALGLRGGIFTFVILIIFFSYLFNKKVNFRLIIPLIIVVIPVFGYLGGKFRDEITQGQLINTDTFDRLNIIKDKLISNKTQKSKDNQNIFDEVYSRFQATRNSVSLINLFDEGKGVEFRPTISSIKALIPQQITGVKNFASSSTDNAYGTAMYVVRSKTYGTSDMGPYLASSHEYWEGGIVYLIISAILLGFIWRSIVKWVIKRRYDTASLIILACFFDAQHGEMSILAPMALIIRLFWFQILPTIIVIYSIDFILKKRLNTPLRVRKFKLKISH